MDTTVPQRWLCIMLHVGVDSYSFILFYHLKLKKAALRGGVMNFDMNKYYNNIEIIWVIFPLNISQMKNIIIGINICLSGYPVKHNTNNKISLNLLPVKDNINP